MFSLLYEAYWGLKEKPFDNTPDPRFLYHSAASSGVFTRLLYTLQSNRGAALLTGGSGCGKTLVARALIQGLNLEKTEVALLANPPWSPDEFLGEILYQLGEEHPPEQRSRAIHRLHEVLYENHAAGKDTLVLIDEGQLIEDSALFEEIRLLLNFQLNDAFLITLLLVGQPLLAARVREYEQLDQRVATHGVLGPLFEDEVHEYITHRLKVAGREDPVFSPEAIELIYEYSTGTPRKINNICDISLVVGFSRKLELIDAGWMQRLIRAESGHAG